MDFVKYKLKLNINLTHLKILNKVSVVSLVAVFVILSFIATTNLVKYVKGTYVAVNLVTIVCLLGVLTYYSQKRPKNFPPGPRWYPFIGNSLQLRRHINNPNGTLSVYQQWRREFSNPEVLGFRLGGVLHIIGLSAKAVYDIHKSSHFDGRPRNLFTYMRTLYTFGGITFTDSNLWKEHRAFTVKHLKKFGFGRYTQELLYKELNELKKNIDKEMNTVGSVWPGQFLRVPISNVTWTLIAEDDKDHYVLAEHLTRLTDKRVAHFDLTGGALTDFPWLRFIAPNYFGYNLLHQINNEAQTILRKIIDNHYRSYTPEKAANSFIHAYIREMKNAASNEKSTFTDSQLMAILMDFVIGGSYKSRVTLDLALMTLATYPHLQNEIYEEVARVAKTNDNPLHLCNPNEFPLSQAFLLEIARFYNPAPLAGPRRTTEDTELCGYYIPKNTTVLSGLAFVHMDKKLWGDPEIFRPCRFLNETKTKVLQPEYFYQFGYGRRKCMGFTLAKSVLHTFLTGIVHDYEICSDTTTKLPQQDSNPGMFKTIKPYKVKFIKRV